jgi:hypothetical protein
MPGSIDQLWSLYAEWKNLTEREGAAIRQSDWPLVHKTQQQKRELQAEIIHLTEEIKADGSSRIDDQKFDRQLRTIVNELILLETQNNATLQATIATTEQQKRELESTSKRLRQIHTRYVPNRPPTWQNLT